MLSLEDRFTKEIGIKFNWHDIDNLIVSDANILRPTFGYSFEHLVDEVFKKYFSINLQEETSGDTDIDRYYFKKLLLYQVKSLEIYWINKASPIPE